MRGQAGGRRLAARRGWLRAQLVSGVFLSQPQVPEAPAKLSRGVQKELVPLNDYEQTIPLSAIIKEYHRVF